VVDVAGLPAGYRQHTDYWLGDVLDHEPGTAAPTVIDTSLFRSNAKVVD
jgi:hypothetical protein